MFKTVKNEMQLSVVYPNARHPIRQLAETMSIKKLLCAKKERRLNMVQRKI